jgi:hypothetical protein
MNLLTISADAKTIKGEKKGLLTAIMYFAPWKLSGYQVCPLAELAGCVGDCLNTAGRGGMARPDADTIEIDGHVVKLNAIQRARIARTRFFFEDRNAFMVKLSKEILAAKKKADKMGYAFAVRLNGTSDIRWENVVYLGKNVFEHFPDIFFYDYTKIPNRKIDGVKNYHLTFSYSARAVFQKIFTKAQEFYGKAMNYAFVYKGEMPKTFMNLVVVNGDEDDARFKDAPGIAIALKAKGRARKSNSGFALAA